MEEHSLADLSEHTRAGSGELASETTKIAAPVLESFELEDGHALTSQPFARPWHARTWDRVSRRYPRLARVVNYARGPQPPVALPELAPLLDRDIAWRSVHVRLRIESTFIRYTRPLTRPALFVALAAAYIVAFGLLAWQQSFRIPAEDFTTCDAVFWSSDARCGLDGVACGPFTNETYEARCPAGCLGLELLNPRLVGNEVAYLRPLVVGGGDANGTYRGDSFICAAALHAGMISNSKGGCFNVNLSGNFTGFVGSVAHGIASLDFPSVFPLSLNLSPNTDLKSCTDIRWPVLAFDALASFLLVAVLRPRAIVVFWGLLALGFWHISLFSDPRGAPPDVSAAFGAFLPALFVGYALWRLAARFVLPVFLARAPLEAAVLLLGPFWVGVLSNDTFDLIPITALIPRDIAQRPGGVVALVVICVVLLVIAVNQVRVIRKTGWLPRYAAWYVAGGLVAMVLALLPGLQFRLHHYILAIGLFPATAFPTRLSLVYQGVLLGLFLNGIAAYGFDSILETAAQLLGDATAGTGTPAFLTNATTYNASVPLANQTLAWGPLADGWDGYALLVDDVDRYEGAGTNFSLAALAAGIPHFFRLAFMSETSYGDFTMAATLWPNGTWVDAPPGAS